MARIAVVSNSYTYLVRFRHELLVTMCSRGHRVIAICPSDAYAKGSTTLAVEHIELPLNQHGLSPVGELHTLTALCGAFRRLRPDVTLNFTIKPAIYGSIAASLTRVPRTISVFTGLGYWFTRPSGSSPIVNKVIRTMLRVSLRSNELVFFQNNDDRQLFITEGLVPSSKTRIVDGSGVDLSVFAPRAAQVSPHTFLLVGRLLREKGVREFVAAASRVRREHPSTRFWLLGPIDTSPSAISQMELQQWIANGDISYLGEVADVRDTLASASVLVLPSYREGTPRSVLEAMAMGKPIITTDAPGCRETVRDGENGFLVPVGDVNALAAAMTRFIGSPDLEAKMGAESRRLVAERYDVRKVNEAFLRQIGLFDEGR